MIICFDVDGTLVSMGNTPNYRVIDILRWFVEHGDRVYIWSGGGIEYAEHWIDKLGIDRFSNTLLPQMKSKEVAEEIKPDITFDDEFITLGKVNIKV